MRAHIKMLLKNTTIIAVGNFATKFLSLLLVPLHTMWVSTDEYGEYDLLNSVASFIIPLITVLLDQAILRFALRDRARATSYLMNSLVIVALNILISNAILLLAFRDRPYMASFVVFLDFYTIYQCCSEYLRGMNKLIKYAAINILVAILCVVLNVIFVNSNGMAVNGILLASGLSYLFGALAALVGEKISLNNLKVNLKTQKEMLKYSVALIPNSLGWWVTNVSDRLVINWAMGNFDNGIYAVACKVPTVITLFYSVFNLAWQQTIFTLKKSKDRISMYHMIYHRLIRILFIAATLVLMGTILVFKFMVPAEYSPGYLYVPILLCGVVFLSLSQFLTGILLADMDSKTVGKSMLIAAAVNLAINLSLIWTTGLFAASISTLVAYVLLFCIRFWKLRKYFKVKKIVKEILLGLALFCIVSVIYYIVGGNVL